MANTIDLKAFAAAYHGEDSEAGAEIAAYLGKLGKKAYQAAVATPELLLFMADRALIQTGDVDKYLLDISWIDYPAVIEKLLRYKKNPPKAQTEADAERAAAAAGDPKNDWMTEKLEDGTLRLASYKGTSTEIAVPTRIGKATVSTIGAFAFTPNKPRLKKEMGELRKKIRSIAIPEGITAIEGDPGERWSYIGNFEGCEGLKTVRLPDTIKALPRGFFRKSGISEVKLPSNLEVIRKEAFAECQKLKSIQFPSHIKELQEDLFEGSALEEFSWPENDGTTVFPYGMFSWCSKLKKVELPKNLTRIDAYAFNGCTKLEELTIPDTVQIIAKGAFQNCQALVELHIPDGVCEIKEGTFYLCQKLLRLYLPASIKNIEPGKRERHTDDRTFGGCEKLVICAPAGSYADSYAKANGIPFAAV